MSVTDTNGQGVVVGQVFYEAQYNAVAQKIEFQEYAVLNIDPDGAYVDLGVDGKIRFYCAVLENGNLDISSLAKSKREALDIFYGSVERSSEHWGRSYIGALKQAEFAKDMIASSVRIMEAISQATKELE
jgi:hypothetical protein